MVEPRAYVIFPSSDVCPFSKCKDYDSEPTKPLGVGAADEPTPVLSHEVLSRLSQEALPELTKTLDKLVKQETTGEFFDDHCDTLTKTIQRLSTCLDLPGLAEIPGYRRHKDVHTAKYASESLTNRPLSVLVPMFVYFTQAKGFDAIDAETTAVLKELFARRIMMIRRSYPLKKRVMIRCERHLYEHEWETHPNDEYYRTGTYRHKGKTYYHLTVYNDVSDYEE